MSVGKKIELARREKGWSQTELGKKINISFTTINRWERGHTKPTTDDLQKIAQATSKPVSYFLEEPALPGTPVKEFRIPIVSGVGATDELGRAHFEPYSPPYEHIEFKDCMSVEVESNSMAPLAYKGQKIIYSKTEPIHNGDLVFIKLKRGEQLFKRYFKDKRNKMISLQPINVSEIYEPITVEEDEVEFMYKVVGVRF